jgi:hypothetical protein
MSTPSWINTLSTASIAADMAAADVNGVVSYAGLERVFADLDAKLVSSGTTLTAAELSDLRTIVANLNNGLSTSSYLVAITQALVDGNAANAGWTGGAVYATTLGNLAAGASATQLSRLIGKWFLGTDLPSSSVVMNGIASFSVSYSTSSKPLFGASGPSMNDVNQGYLGDCYLLSGLAEVAYLNASVISSMFTSNGNGTYGVRFYVDGQAEYVTVDSSLANGGTVFNHASDIWASLAEKAYAQLQAGGVETGNSVNYGNSFSTIGNGGAPEAALEEITGASAITDFEASGSSWAEVVYSSSLQVTSYTTAYATASVTSMLVADLAQGDDLVLSSYTDATDSAGKSTLIADHAMSIFGFDNMTGMFEIRNPWGTASGQTWDTTFEVSLATLLADGDTISADNVGQNRAPPSLTVSSNLAASRGQSLALSSLVTVSDPNHLGYQKLELWDSNSTVVGGEFVVNGVAQTGAHEIDVSPADVANTVFDVGTLGGSDALWARLLLNDGTLSSWQAFTVTAPLGHTPVATAADYTAAHGQNIAATSLFSVTDADGNAIVAYQLWDSTSDPASGHWVVAGVAQAAGQTINVTPAQLAGATFQSGSGSADLWVRANDGIAWGAWTEFHVNAPVDAGPTVSVANLTATHGQSFAGASLFSNYSDPFASAATQYDVWDTGAGGGHFVLNGTALAAGQNDVITAAQLAQLSYQSGSGADALWIRANDGTVWGAWSSAFTVTAPIDSGPTVNVANLTASHGQSFAGASLFSNYSDPFASPATQYDVWDTGAGGGHFVLNGTALAAGQNDVITAAQLAQLSYQSGSGADTLWVRANDGTVWGAWSNAFTVTAPVDPGPALTVGNLTATPGQSLAASSLFSYGDPFGSPATQYDFWDSGGGGGHFALNGTAQGTSQDNIISAAQLSQMTYQAGTGTDTLWIRANDGTVWGAWSHAFSVTA